MSSFPVRITQDGFPVEITDIPQNWISIGTNVCKGGGSRVTTSQTSRTLCITPIDINAIRLVFSNTYTGGTGETPNTNKILVRASIQPMGSSINAATSDPIYRITFGGSDNSIVSGGGLLISDPLPISFLANTKFFIKSYGKPIGGNPPSAPTISASGSGSSLNGTFSVCITAVYPNGFESSPSSGTSITLTSGQNINITSPSQIAGAIGYRVWVTYPPGSITDIHYDSGLGVINFGTNVIFSQGLPGSAQQNIEQVDPSGILYLPVGGGVAGGTTNAFGNTGESRISSVDYTIEGKSMTPISTGNAFMPICVLGYNSTSYQKSVAIIGDSISSATADYGFMSQKGGFMLRAIMNQISAVPINVNINPPYGNTYLGQGAETAAQFASNAGFKRSVIANLSSTIWSNYGTNDLSSYGTTIINSLYTIAMRFIIGNKTFIQSDIIPKNNTTDLFTTIANQTFSVTSEINRRQLNNWISKSTTTTSVVNEIPMRRESINGGISYNFYSGGNGSAVIFISNLPFVVGTEQVYKGGILQTLNTNYTYISQLTINGVSYASGISFVVAPGNGVSVTISYTSILGMIAFVGSIKCKYMPTAQFIEYNSSGTNQLNGGFTKISESPIVGPRALTGVTGSSITDITQSWTTDQYRGYSVAIISDPITPSSVGQINGIQYNTSNLLSFPSNFAITPSLSATYQIFKSYTLDGVHPTSFGHLLIAQNMNTTLFD